ncbi:MAG: glycosyltransferase family 39 protein [Weeksellaceae bacterium]
MEFLFTQTPLKFFAQDFWRDEAFSYILSQQPLTDLLRLTAGDFNPPLYYILLKYWSMIVGHSEIALRSLSLIFFAITLVFIYETFLNVFKFSQKKAFIYIAFVAWNPFLLYYAFEARMYMMITCLATISFYAFLQKHKKLYILTAALGLYTHYFMIFVIATQFLYRFGPTLYQRFIKKIKSKEKVSAFPTFTYFLIIGLLWLPWVIYLITQHNFAGSGDFWIVRPPLKDIFYVPFVLYTGYERVLGLYYHGKAGYTSFHTLFNTIMIAIMLLPLLITKFNQKKKQNHHLLTLNKHLSHEHIQLFVLWAFFTPYLLIILSYVVQPFYLPRYFIFCTPGLLILLVWCIEKLPRVPKIVVFVLLVWMTQQFHTANLEYRHKKSVSKAYKEIREVIKPGDMIYTNDLDYFLARYYLPDAEVKIYERPYDSLASYVGKSLIPRDAVTLRLPYYPYKAFMIYHDWYEVKSQY